MTIRIRIRVTSRIRIRNTGWKYSIRLVRQYDIQVYLELRCTNPGSTEPAAALEREKIDYSIRITEDMARQETSSLTSQHLKAFYPEAHFLVFDWGMKPTTFLQTFCLRRSQ